MKTYTNTSDLRPRHWVAAALVALAGFGAGGAGAGTLTSTACTATSATAKTCSLYAKSAVAALPITATTTTNVTIWGYTDTSSGTLNQPGGPVLIVNQGDAVTVNLTNNLTVPTALMFHGQGGVLPGPGAAGAAGSGGTAAYTFTATNPGTYLYEASPLGTSTQYQSAMGLYGALVVRPATVNQAYASPATAYDDEAAAVLSEIDPALNNGANPASFDMRNYAPKYYLINGKYHPNTDLINAAAGHKLLVRYVNAGVQQHSMAVLGLRQNFVAKDGGVLPQFSHDLVAESLAPGESADAILTVPPGATNGNKFTLYDARLDLHNGTAPGMGGMLTFVSVGAATTTYPSTTGVTLNPNPTDGTSAVTVSASVASDPAITTASITAAEFFIDAAGANGAGTPMTVIAGSASGTIPVTTLAALSPGNHTVYVHSQQTATTAVTWGTFASAALTISTATDPTTTAVTLTPSTTDRSAPVAVAATINTTSAGASVDTAEFFIDTQGTSGTGTAMTVTAGSAAGSISTTALAGLSVGPHTVYVHGHRTAGTTVPAAWGAFSSATLTVGSGPTTDTVTLTPAITDGSAAVGLSTTITATTGTVARAEYFIDNPGSNGSGTALTGTFTTASVAATGALSTAQLAALANGAHTIYVHGQGSPGGATGTWGPFTVASLTVNKPGPATTGLVISPSATSGSVDVSISATANSSLVGNGAITAAEYWIDAGAHIPMSITTPGAPISAITGAIPAASVNVLTAGAHTVSVRSRTGTASWGPVATVNLIVDKTAPTISGITPNPATVRLATGSVTLTIAAADALTSVVGGDYWLDGTAIPPATTLAFIGTSPAISTAALPAGTHTVRVRVKDVAGNLSTVSNVTLYVAQAVADARSITASGSPTQTSDANAGAGVLVNDQPIGVTGRTANLLSVPIRTAGVGAGTIALSCPTSLGTAATPAVSGQTICTNGAYRVTLTGVGGSNNARAASKRGTYQFTYTETLNGIGSSATVTITVN
ncbi:MAG: hypothetical protein FIA97_02415 [Methylococcaceae bacterium]|nr:hypothetical protein [Methylococcaceae bacterium]